MIGRLYREVAEEAYSAVMCLVDGLVIFAGLTRVCGHAGETEFRWRPIPRGRLHKEEKVILPP